MLKKNIKEIVRHGLCISCGTCQGVCQVEAIKLQLNSRKGLFLPVVEKKCNLCGICYAVCPGREIYYDKLNIEFYGQVPTDVFIGNYRNIWIGHSANDSIRYKASSGGLVTSLLILALEEGVIDAAVVLGMDKDNPLLAKPFIARTSEEIMSGMGSKYASGPVNSMISEIMKNEGKCAIVGLPCHIAALRKAELQMRKLKERVVLHFGLFCSTMISYIGLDFWLSVNKIDPQNVIGLSYRGNGWPGEMTVKLRQGKDRIYPSPEYFMATYKFTTKRCTLCVDGLAELADISFGDAWLSEFADDKKGTSICLIRSQAGEELIDLAIQKKKLDITEATRDMLIRSQSGMLKFKKEGYYYRTKTLTRSGKKVPTYIGGFIKNGKGSYTESIFFYLNLWLFRQRFLWKFLYKWYHLKNPPRRAFNLIKILPFKAIRHLYIKYLKNISTTLSFS